MQDAAQKDQQIDAGGRGERRRLGAQMSKPAENVGITAQLMQRTNGGMLLAEIDQEIAGSATVLTGWSRD